MPVHTITLEFTTQGDADIIDITQQVQEAQRRVPEIGRIEHVVVAVEVPIQEQVFEPCRVDAAPRRWEHKLAHVRFAHRGDDAGGGTSLPRSGGDHNGGISDPGEAARLLGARLRQTQNDFWRPSSRLGGWFAACTR